MYRNPSMTGFTAAQDYFGSKSDQRLIKDEVVFAAGSDPYAAIFEAARRIEHARKLHSVEENHKEVNDNARLLPSV